MMIVVYIDYKQQKPGLGRGWTKTNPKTGSKGSRLYKKDVCFYTVYVSHNRIIHNTQYKNVNIIVNTQLQLLTINW